MARITAKTRAPGRDYRGEAPMRTHPNSPKPRPCPTCEARPYMPCQQRMQSLVYGDPTAPPLVSWRVMKTYHRDR